MEAGIVVMPLGGGQEVGRSCILLQLKGRNILLDCGIHPGRDGMDSLPFFDNMMDLGIEPSDIDLILITHFHLDHSASLPYFTKETNFQGRIFMTHATKAVMRTLISDYIKLTSDGLYDDNDLNECIKRCEVIDFHQSMEFNGIKFTPYPAGHVLGAAMFEVEIDGVRVLYTGDYSMEEDRHLSGAKICCEEPDLLIVESTYGTQHHASIEERESRFTKNIEDIVRRGGTCLIPVFALGRAQELLLILEEYWRSSPDLQDIPVYYCSRLASKALHIYQTFVNMMNTHIRQISDIGNPFDFRFIKNSTEKDLISQAQFGGLASVIIASPGMLQSGVSRQILENICDDDRNGVMLAGYSVDGTLANKLLANPNEITCMDGRIKSRKCSIEYVAFSAHVDYSQNWGFICNTVPDNIVLVHGEKHEMQRLARQLDRDIQNSGSWPVPHIPQINTPSNGSKVTFMLAKRMTAQIVGNTATTLLNEIKDNDDEDVPKNKKNSKSKGSGKRKESDLDIEEEMQIKPIVKADTTSQLSDQLVLVSENFRSKVVGVNELPTHTRCRRGRIVQRITLPIPSWIQQSPSSSSVSSSSDVNDNNSVIGLPDAWALPGLFRIVAPYLAEVFSNVHFEWESAKASSSNNNNNKTGKKNGNNTNNGKMNDNVALFIENIVVLREQKANTTKSSSSSSSSSSSKSGILVIEWASTPMADMVADCCISTITQVFSPIAGVMRTSNFCMSPSINQFTFVGPDKINGVFTLPGNGSRSRMHRHHKKRRAEEAEEIGQDGTNTADNTVSEAGGKGTEEDYVVENMKLGLIDPRGSIQESLLLPDSTIQKHDAEGESSNSSSKPPSQAKTKSSSNPKPGKKGVIKEEKMDVETVDIDSITTDPKKLLANRLRNLRDQILNRSTTINYARLNHHGNKLILRTINDEGAVDQEAFCFFQFNVGVSDVEGGDDGHPNIHAVVESENDQFRKVIIDVLSTLGKK